MDPEKRHPILTALLKHSCKRQRTTLAQVTTAITLTGQARSMAIAKTMQTWLRVQPGSAWDRLYRPLRDRRIDDLVRPRVPSGEPGSSCCRSCNWTSSSAC